MAELVNIKPSVCESETVEGVVERLRELHWKVTFGEQWALVSSDSGIKNVLVTVRVTVAALPLTQDQEDRLRLALIEHSRFIPVKYGISKQPDGSQGADILLRYRVEALPVEARGIVRMAVLLHQNDEYNRFSFVEMSDGNFEVKWDSGELVADKVDMEFDDVDGDGKPEIVVTGERPTDVGEPSNNILAVFDLQGNELTRQENCVPGPFELKADEMVCPLEGAEISFLAGATPSQIEVTQNWSSTHPKRTIYRFNPQRRRYVEIDSRKAKPG